MIPTRFRETILLFAHSLRQLGFFEMRTLLKNPIIRAGFVPILCTHLKMFQIHETFAN